MINLQTPRESIITSFAHSFNVGLEEADEALQEILQIHEAKDSLNQRRILRCKNDPGFKVEISKTESNIVVVVYGITHYEYIEYLDVFVHNLILFSQKAITGEDIQAICKKKSDIKIKEIEQVEEVEVENEAGEDLDFLNFNMNKFIGMNEPFVEKGLDLGDITEEADEESDQEPQDEEADSVESLN